MHAIHTPPVRRKHRAPRLLPALLVLVMIIGGTATADDAYTGYTLFAPLDATAVTLIDINGDTMHTWNTQYRPGNAVYLLENGQLLHTGNLRNDTFLTAETPPGPNQNKGPKNKDTTGDNGRPQNAGGTGGIVQLIEWDGHVTWEYTCSSDRYLQHHDVEMLPNGNVLLIAWEYKTAQEALDMGRSADLLEDGALWPDSILEIQPTGTQTGNIVWEWHIWDHLVQDEDPALDTYGDISAHPERIDLNYARSGGADWTHINAVDYNAALDQILLSVHNFNEIWIIDHSTTTAEAAGHTGGTSGRGGDLLYRFGNPAAYGSGSRADQTFFGQHDAQWIAEGLPGAGNILGFNNGAGRRSGRYSTVDEISLSYADDGSYSLSAEADALVWRYIAETPEDFFAQNISGAQRLPNGNTLICSGPSGYFFEVTSEGDTVWTYQAQGNVFTIKRYAPEYPGLEALF